MLNQLPRISLASSRRFATKVDEVVGVVVSLGHHVVLSVVQEREELVEEALPAFG